MFCVPVLGSRVTTLVAVKVGASTQQALALNNIGLLEGTANGTHHTDGTPYVPPRPDLDSLKPASFAAAQSIAEKSATLLKNDGSTLPLSSGDNAVVMGPTA